MTPLLHVVAVGRNVEKVAPKMLESLLAQSSADWEITIVNDCSEDGTLEVVQKFLLDNTESVQGSWIMTSKRVYGVEATLQALAEVSDEQVAVFVDLDDYLLTTTALEMIADVYRNDPELDVVWTEHRYLARDGTVTQKNVSGPLPPGVDPYVYPWVSSHLKTVRRRVLDEIADENFRGSDGEYFKFAADQAIMLPALTCARRWQFIPVPTYAYRPPPGGDPNRESQVVAGDEEAKFIRQRGFVE